MTIPEVLIGVIAMMVLQGILLAAAWGDLRRQVTANRELQDERHDENRRKLETLDEKVDDLGTRLGHLER